ncbi:neutral zinc metallopeptidase [Zobellella sp. DQSA1]|uniref:KPN_02809 family neutral zinc metallopeptidase n=1 Tax=Zobellella sp. DQSA1 TaxID=3342386 RepID=UPI0035BF88F4
MRWEHRRRSSNVEDRRGASAGTPALMGLLIRLLPWLLRTKAGRILLVAGAGIFVGARMLGVDLLPLVTGQPTPVNQHRSLSAEEQKLAEFVSVVLADTEDTWQPLFARMGSRYQDPTLVLFSGQVQSACGFAQAAMGPFYCPGDGKVYIDLSFYKDLKERHGAPGDFAQAYVIAHEVGHHVQNLLGISRKIHEARRRLPEVEANLLSVRQELQADCFAGIWGFYANQERQLLEPGDLEEALTAAAAIGDDRLQQQARGRITPDSFTHGSSEQRVRWFKRGFDSGELEYCNTFDADRL